MVRKILLSLFFAGCAGGVAQAAITGGSPGGTGSGDIGGVAVSGGLTGGGTSGDVTVTLPSTWTTTLAALESYMSTAPVGGGGAANLTSTTPVTGSTYNVTQGVIGSSQPFIALIVGMGLPGATTHYLWLSSSSLVVSSVTAGTVGAPQLKLNTSASTGTNGQAATFGPNGQLTPVDLIPSTSPLFADAVNEMKGPGAVHSSHTIRLVGYSMEGVNFSSVTSGVAFPTMTVFGCPFMEPLTSSGPVVTYRVRVGKLKDPNYAFVLSSAVVVSSGAVGTPDQVVLVVSMSTDTNTAGKTADSAVYNGATTVTIAGVAGTAAYNQTVAHSVVTNGWASNIYNAGTEEIFIKVTRGGDPSNTGVYLKLLDFLATVKQGSL